jgi:hypothetical protein
MAGTSAGQFAARLDPAACNALGQGAAGLLVPEVRINADPGLTITPPADSDCPQAWRIGVDGAWAQTPPIDFLHSLTGASRAWEVVTELPALTIPRAGVWEITYQVRGVAQLPAPGLANIDTGVVASLYRNGALVPGTEALVIYHNEASLDQGKQIQASACRQGMHQFAAGDTVRLAACRLATSGIASVVSNSDGRTSITAHWVAPEGDTAG